jgi:tungstate transport system substrate-binding protein
MKNSLKLFASTALVSLLAACATPMAAPTATPTPPQNMTLATTTSTQDSGLLDSILPTFEKQFNVKVKVVAVGTGQALKLGEDGNADVVLVHARAQEDDFVKKGFGINRRDVMYNDFIIVGPKSDPAKVSGTTTASDALKKIAATSAKFASRGDKSGTNTKELDLWKAAGIEPKGDWYVSVGQGMAETLNFAQEKQAYTLTDRATWLAQKAKLAELIVVTGGNNIAENSDKALLNPYGVIPVNPARYPSIKADLAEKFATWITSVDAQKLIAEYGKAQYGQQLFYPDSEAWRAQKK